MFQMFLHILACGSVRLIVLSVCDNLYAQKTYLPAPAKIQSNNKQTFAQLVTCSHKLSCDIVHAISVMFYRFSDTLKQLPTVFTEVATCLTQLATCRRNSSLHIRNETRLRSNSIYYDPIYNNEVQYLLICHQLNLIYNSICLTKMFFFRCYTHRAMNRALP